MRFRRRASFAQLRLVVPGTRPLWRPDPAELPIPSECSRDDLFGPARLSAHVLADRHVTIETSDEAADWLAKNGFDELYGARPLARVIQEHIKKPLADEILFGRLIKGGHVKVVLKDGKLAFEIEGEERERGAPVVENPKEAAEPVD